MGGALPYPYLRSSTFLTVEAREIIQEEKGTEPTGNQGTVAQGGQCRTQEYPRKGYWVEGAASSTCCPHAGDLGHQGKRPR